MPPGCQAPPPGQMELSALKSRAETAGKDRWCPGERCLAPSPDNGKLCEASIKSVTVDENGKSFAVILYSDSLERKVPLRRLQEVKSVKDCSRSFIFDDEDLEKPYFPDRKFPSSAIAFKLSEDGDCIPHTINRYLRDYQREGAQFLYGHYIQGRGCILGDDMGLGKTVQVISFLAAVLHKKGTREDIENNMPEFLLRSMKKETPSCTARKMFLIVAPLSVLYNWRDELDTWGYFRVIILHGNKKDNELIRVKQRKCEIALTTYETLRLYLDEFNSLEWSAVIVDEAHRIKNPNARVTEVMKALKCNVRIGLTGTILQNNMKELWCVMDWAVPGLLGSRIHFKKQFSDPVEHGQRHTATKRELATGRKAMRRLGKKMSGWFLRRTKTLIKDQLPKKEDRIVYCSLTDFQKAVYQTVLETEDITLILQSSEPCTCGSGRKGRNCCYKINSQGETVKTLYFSYLAVLQKVANHVALLQAASTSEQQKTLINNICDRVFSRFPDFVQKSKDAAFETISDPKYSGKMKVLQQLLNHCRKNRDKVLLFSFSTKLLDVLQQYCMAAGLDFRRLDGSTKSEERIKIVKEFNSAQDVNICLVSTMAGGLGLNFVGANVVVLFDPTWNPANDLQAIDRAYRIGQCRDVKVLRLISLGTVEEIMYLRQVYKQQLHCVVVGSENAKRYFEAVQGSKEHQGELFGIHNLFKLRSQGSCLTRDILEREGQVEAGIMTATTWWREGPPAHKQEMPREPDCQEYRGPEQPAEPLTEEACDLCSDFSDEESVGNSRIKTAKSKASHSSKASGVPGQLTLLQCGFSKLFETNYKAVEDSNEDDASDGESSDEQPTCHFTEAVDDRIVGCQKSQNSRGPLEHQKKAGIINPNEKFIFDKSEKTLKQNISSESSGEKKFKNPIEHQNVTESEDSDVIFPTQYATQRFPKCSIRFKPPLDGSEDSETDNAVKLKNDDDTKTDVRGNGPISKKLNPESITLKSVMKRKGTSDISDESDDIEITSRSRVRKQRATSSLRLKKEKESKSKLYSFPQTTKKTNQVYTTGKGCNSLAIDEFSSSDDDLSVSHISSSRQSRRPKITKDTISFSSKLPNRNKKNTTFISRKQMKFSNERIVSQEQIHESVDKFLDGVQEVAYVHSNQNVIGSSKAENHMSRWAARDVFELKQFSQLPANVAICSSKVSNIPFEAVSPPTHIYQLKITAVDPFQTYQEKIKKDTSTYTKKGQQPGKGDISFPFYISYPVSQKKKKVYRTDQTTFIIGETPKRIRRKQFEEMASYFNISSVKEFAEHITNGTSEERQKILRDFYGSQYPEIKDFFVDSASKLIKSAHEKGEKIRNKSEERESLMKEELSDSETLSFKDSTKKISQICSPKLYKEKSIKLQSYDFCGEAVFSNDTETEKLPVSSTQEIDDGLKSQLSKDTVASCSPNCKSEVCERKFENTMKDQQDLTKIDISRNGPLFKSETKKIDNPTLGNISMGELLGDTSILDDLFKSHGNSLTRLPKKVLSRPMEKSKQRPKDFWDILNEQNDDSLSKLTDLAVIETLCEKVPLATSSKRKEELETSLWKSNKKFLWKKRNSSDTDENTTST
ncbi:DNA excision repair protein ERCC-6-like 2 isoform X3 [Trichechus manatus latirostris]|uniref:DNA excision repair protein ERCC-6-like 2 n=1 Tax=Trichechus manatus latirostris TaxID=127582 RepID=A0A2Y9R832_TRIMA|nr:DNA excision repair protein ERCC-6-like 2 isoform X3 [Trichechus manatus latirostris]